jgi:hypothetical protein
MLRQRQDPWMKTVDRKQKKECPKEKRNIGFFGINLHPSG